jgi:hypothetical protein
MTMMKFGGYHSNVAEDLNFEISKLTPYSWVLLEKLISPQLVKKFPAFYRTQRFVMAN